ncbi:MAG: methyltransferase domain-containing protein [Acidimicrobiia bacterium]
MSDPGYTHGHHESVLRSHRWRTAENSCAYLLPHLRPGMRVLDVGCGPGTITLDLARRVAPGPVVGIEPPADIVDGAARDAAAQGVDNVTFTVGDVYALDLDALDPQGGGRPFDVVHAHQVLQHLPDPVGALRAMRAACAPDGLVAVRDADYHAFTWFPADPRLDRWLDVYQQVARADGGEPDAGRMLSAWANAAGFSEVTSSASVWCFANEEDRAWWGGLWADRITSSRVGGRAQELGIADAAELADLAAGWRAWAADPDGWFAVLHGELLCRP